MQRPPLPLPARPAPDAAANTSLQLSPTLIAAIDAAAFMQCLATAEVEALNGPVTREQFARECMRTGAALALQMALDAEVPASHSPPSARVPERIRTSRTAIHSLLQRIQRDPRLAYYFDPLTQSFEDLTAAHALNYNLPDLEQFRKDYAGTLTFEAPADPGIRQ